MRKVLLTSSVAIAAFILYPNAASASSTSEMCLTMSSPIVDAKTIAELCGALNAKPAPTAGQTTTTTTPANGSTTPTLQTPTLQTPTLQTPTLQTPTLEMPTLPPMAMPTLPPMAAPVPPPVAGAPAPTPAAQPQASSAQASSAQSSSKQSTGTQDPMAMLDQLQDQAAAQEQPAVEQAPVSGARHDSPFRSIGFGLGGLLVGLAAVRWFRRPVEYYDEYDEYDDTGDASVEDAKAPQGA